jgi:DNA polymerase epsilon subunit 1
MEDIGSGPQVKHTIQRAVVHKKAHPPAVSEAHVAPDIEPPLPDPSKNYSAWIKAMRPRWRKRREAPSGSTSNIFGNARPQVNHRWDIIQLRPTPTPGRYMLWLSVNSQLTSVPLRIPRIFYISLINDSDTIFLPEYYEYEKVTRTLPRDISTEHLYKITVREEVYLEIQEHFIDLVNSPNVNGVYEQRVWSV